MPGAWLCVHRSALMGCWTEVTDHLPGLRFPPWGARIMIWAVCKFKEEEGIGPAGPRDKACPAFVGGGAPGDPPGPVSQGAQLCCPACFY